MVPGWTETVCAHSPVESASAGVTVSAEAPECGAAAVTAASAGPPVQLQPGMLPQSARFGAGTSKPGLVARLTVAAVAAVAAVGPAGDAAPVAPDGVPAGVSAEAVGTARAVSSATEAASADRRVDIDT